MTIIIRIDSNAIVGLLIMCRPQHLPNLHDDSKSTGHDSIVLEPAISDICLQGLHD